MNTSRFLVTRFVRILPAALAMVLSLIPVVSGAEPSRPLIVGWIERVHIDPGDFLVPAKIDTGAVSCSLHAPNVVEFQKQGKKWVRFVIKDAAGKERTIEQPVTGTRRIKRHYGGFQMRPVIRLNVCLGPVSKEADVNLVDRTGFEYPMLIGRNFMDGSIIVNPSAQYTVEPVRAKRGAERK